MRKSIGELIAEVAKEIHVMVEKLKEFYSSYYAFFDIQKNIVGSWLNIFSIQKKTDNLKLIFDYGMGNYFDFLAIPGYSEMVERYNANFLSND